MAPELCVIGCCGVLGLTNMVGTDGDWCSLRGWSAVPRGVVVCAAVEGVGSGVKN